MRILFSVLCRHIPHHSLFCPMSFLAGTSSYRVSRYTLDTASDKYMNWSGLGPSARLDTIDSWGEKRNTSSFFIQFLYQYYHLHDCLLLKAVLCLKAIKYFMIFAQDCTRLQKVLRPSQQKNPHNFQRRFFVYFCHGNPTVK